MFSAELNVAANVVVLALGTTAEPPLLPNEVRATSVGQAIDVLADMPRAVVVLSMDRLQPSLVTQLKAGAPTADIVVRVPDYRDVEADRCRRLGVRFYGADDGLLYAAIVALMRLARRRRRRH